LLSVEVELVSPPPLAAPFVVVVEESHAPPNLENGKLLHERCIASESHLESTWPRIAEPSTRNAKITGSTPTAGSSPH
jgi:hypothetical protein